MISPFVISRLILGCTDLRESRLELLAKIRSSFSASEFPAGFSHDGLVAGKASNPGSKASEEYEDALALQLCVLQYLQVGLASKKVMIQFEKAIEQFRDAQGKQHNELQSSLVHLLPIHMKNPLQV
mmetsp:Transcript_17978/g.36818  ORF Transcript_17978/g.36818 Transcript_17978/m.36818 type:complete len:126 (-) Transcript_17978:17-394(-)